MTYRGKFSNGVVVFDHPPPLDEGAMVEVEVVEAAGEDGPRELALPSWGEVFGDLVGKAAGMPPDMARNHDHYIHGTRKR